MTDPRPFFRIPKADRPREGLPDREPVWHPLFLSLMFDGHEHIGIRVQSLRRGDEMFFMWMYPELPEKAAP